MDKERKMGQIKAKNADVAVVTARLFNEELAYFSLETVDKSMCDR